MGELWSYYENDLMSAQQAFWFEPRPEEEFYDLALDPHEVNNLVEDPRYQDELDRMRTAFTDWQARVADYSEKSEVEMSAGFWPDGEQPLTMEPAISVEKGKVVLQCETVGASIGYRLDGGRWQVYSQPFYLPSGSKLSVKAVRYGWKESKEITL
jgi:N-sulfoglucosamine sulfohydrolase